MAAQQHTPFHAPWAAAGPHGYQLSGVGGTRNEEGSAPPTVPYPSGLCGLRSWVPHTSGHAFWGGVVSPIEPGHQPSEEYSVPDCTPHLRPSHAWWRGPPCSPPQCSRAPVSLTLGPT